MKFRIRYLMVALALTTAPPVVSVEADDALDALKQQMQQMQEQMKLMQQKIEQLEAAKTSAPPASVTAPAPTEGAATPEKSKLTEQLAKELSGQSAFPPMSNKPIMLFSGGGSYANLSLDVLGLAGTSSRADVSRVDPGGANQRGFELQEAEIFIDGAVDPYFYGAGNFSFGIDQNGETGVEIEEAYLRTTSLPWNLQVQAGQYKTAFGRLNLQHTHMWDFVDPSLVNARFLGTDGLRNPGVQISWLAPTPFYTVAYLSVQDSQGGTASSFLGSSGDVLFGRTLEDRHLRSAGDLLYVPRIASSFDLSDQQALTVGASAAFGPNSSGTDARTQIYGVDAYWKWKPANAGAWPFVKWQTEAIWRRYEAGADTVAGLPAETLNDWGAYSQLVWGFHQGWTAALRGDYVSGDRGAFEPDPDRDQRWRISPALTWYLSEFSKLRLQYNFDEIDHFGQASSVWMQFEFVLGAHGAHPY
jgi:hypothetical protein